MDLVGLSSYVVNSLPPLPGAGGVAGGGHGWHRAGPDLRALEGDAYEAAKLWLGRCVLKAARHI